MKTILLISFLIVTGISYGQGFNRGYDVGWQTGYCYDASYGCIAPLTPIPPLPSIYESSTSYSDGYHRGLTDGMNKGRADRRKKSNSQMNTQQPYSTPQYIPKYEPFVPDFEFYEKVLQKKQNSASTVKTNKDNSKQTGYVWTKEHTKMANLYNSQSETEKRKTLMKSIRSQISSLQYYPDKLPNGWHQVYFIDETKYKFKDLKGVKSDCEKRYVIVSENKIIYVQEEDKFGKGSFFQFDYDFFRTNPFDIPTLVSSSEIVKGIASATNSVWLNDADTKAFMYEMTKDGQYYFLDYLVRYNNAQILLSEVKSKYASAPKSGSISDGWHVAYLTDKKTLCDIRNVYVKNNKVIKWIGGQGDENSVGTGGEINNLKSTFSWKLPSLNSSQNETWNRWTQHTWMNRPKTEIFDVYFINL